jgi:hypothetical protein
VAQAAAKDPAVLKCLKLSGTAERPIPTSAVTAEAAVAAALTPDANGNLPLHAALADDAEEGTVTHLLALGGRATAGARGVDKALPLHYAARYSSRPAVVQLLLGAFPAGITCKDTACEQTPLQRAEAFNRTSAAKSIVAILREAAAATR